MHAQVKHIHLESRDAGLIFLKAMDVDEDFKSATDLARAWEGIPHLRRRGSQLRVVLVWGNNGNMFKFEQ